MEQPKITQNRIMLAFAIAVFADMCEFPITYVEHDWGDFFRMLAGASDVLLDCAVMMAMVRLLGFHWIFLPSFCLEVIPTLDICPTWVACVGYVLWEQKRKEDKSLKPSPFERALDVLKEKAVSMLPPVKNATPATIEVASQVSPPNESAIEKRLKHLQELRAKDLISQTEYETKRQQILGEL